MLSIKLVTRRRWSGTQNIVHLGRKTRPNRSGTRKTLFIRSGLRENSIHWFNNLPKPVRNTKMPIWVGIPARVGQDLGKRYLLGQDYVKMLSNKLGTRRRRSLQSLPEQLAHDQFLDRDQTVRRGTIRRKIIRRRTFRCAENSPPGQESLPWDNSLRVLWWIKSIPNLKNGFVHVYKSIHVCIYINYIYIYCIHRAPQESILYSYIYDIVIGCDTRNRHWVSMQFPKRQHKFKTLTRLIISCIVINHNFILKKWLPYSWYWEARTMNCSYHHSDEERHYACKDTIFF